MKNAFNRMVDLFSAYLEPRQGIPKDSLAWYREKIVMSTFGVATLVGAVVVVPVFFLMKDSGHGWIAWADIALFFLLAILFFARIIPYWIKSFALILIPAMVAAMLFFSFGPAGAGGYWLFAANVGAAFLFGVSGIVAGFALNVLVFAFFGLSMQFMPWSYDPERWIAISQSFIALSLFACVPVAQVPRRLSARLAQSRREFVDLKESRQAVIVTNERLVREAEARQRAETELVRGEARFRAILDHLSDVVLVVDGAGPILYASGACRNLVGANPEDLKGRLVFDFVDEADRHQFRDRFRAFAAGGMTASEFPLVLRRTDGDTVRVECRASNQLGNRLVEGIVVAIRDVSDLRDAEARAQFYEHFDPLTRLPNRRSFLGKLEAALEVAANRGRRSAVVTVGLDAFKPFNDLYGVQSGDEALRAVARALESLFRDDDVVARESGDRFAILLREVRSADDLPVIAEKTMRAVREAHTGMRETPLGCSVGIAVFPEDGTTARELLRNSESAMMGAKCRGKGEWKMFDPAVTREILARLALEREIDAGLSRNEFIPYYQPKVDRSGALAGFEALARWKRGDGIIAAPGAFMEAAERSGRDIALGYAVLDQVCARIARWKAEGLKPVPVSVNVSAAQLGRGDFREAFKAALGRSGVDAPLVEIEITESGIMENDDAAIAELEALRALGIRVAIDDFGTGYSSFSKLLDFPVDTLKIDRSFVAPLPGDARAGAIAAAIIDVAHTIGCDVVAEGVETSGQEGFLSAHGCDYYQGYLFSRPIPETEAGRVLADGRSVKGDAG